VWGRTVRWMQAGGNGQGEKADKCGAPSGRPGSGLRALKTVPGATLCRDLRRLPESGSNGRAQEALFPCLPLCAACLDGAATPWMGVPGICRDWVRYEEHTR
jgi:hypothetical protein